MKYMSLTVYIKVEEYCAAQTGWHFAIYRDVIVQWREIEILELLLYLIDPWPLTPIAYVNTLLSTE